MRAHHLVTRLVLASLLGGALALGCSDEPVDNLPPEPQIFPRLNPVNICQIEVGQSTTVDLMLDNRGQQRLDIQSYEVHHDRRCAFTAHSCEVREGEEICDGGDVRLFDNDDSDEFAATVRTRDSAFMRIQYTPPSVGEDGISITVHSNAANFPDLEVFVCGGGTDSLPLRCDIRLEDGCQPSGESCDDENPCELRCFEGRNPCQTAADCAEGDFCYSPHICRLTDPTDPGSGQCVCRPCTAPPNEDWEDCSLPR